jgi:uncharacterized protein (DUF433 family)
MDNRIVIHPSVHFGKPCVAGTRIPVLNVLELVSEGISFERITKEFYPDITLEDVQACIKYAMNVLATEEIHVSVTA